MPSLPPPLSALLTFTKTLAVSHLLATHVLAVERTAGPSMLPTLSVRGDAVLVDKTCRRGRGVAVGDVVQLRHPVVEGEGVVKRVVGLGGDYVVLPGGEGAGGGGEGELMVQVPEGHCWVLGDNQAASRDSRTYGPVPLALVRGRVVARVWPLGEMGWIRNGLVKAEDEGV